ncbi:putative F-box domain, leucine-rich repeat domain superfamily, F-box-like domain superfamily [Helianthus annuus]|nr:putative F-box domain, leucine-rich repeat domain superfamily, F-box-like domain superfamily [Helianthus annuus]KAJ0628299.1 putative F-box domain, leucine-rich repeat domain superfamily, F-box-like domain superfamily [Helianthus annuus]KAJ0784582.1 putative F-box domain, leucine-rich repeat domain superfamily, F-box-like domain superfamily [Helianthus annuus]KAJ0949641.1 putative F-box domain, leucine-rich repeat domain superfamily, F-box-like domain superfamily [Helianthus annuus]
MISNLPQPIIEIILCLLPTKEAVRTSILSREWKYHWTTIPKLAFIEDAVKASRDDDGLKERLSIEKLNQVISMHQGPIHEFSLSMHAKDPPCVEFDHIMDNFLSRNNNTLTKLTLDMCYGRLTYLYMGNVIISKRMLILFLSSCPLLTIVTLNANVGSLPTAGDFTLIELFGCLPVIENLSICLRMMTDFAQGRVPNKLPIALVHLKCLCIRDACAPNQGDRIPCLLFLMRSCPNLEKLKLKIYHSLRFRSWTNHSDMWFAHLNELEIEFWARRHFMMNLLPHMLAKSPVLKMVKILLRYKVSKDEESDMVRRYSAYAHASPVVEITVESGVGFKFDRF